MQEAAVHRWRVGVVGLGHVGRITVESLRMRCDVVTYELTTAQDYPSAEFAKCDFIVICVNTPSPDGGAADLGQVHSAFAALPPDVPAVLRSTVPPGTSSEMARCYQREVIFWPEYLGESKFVVDTMDAIASRPFHIIGAQPSPIASEWTDLLAETYGPLVRMYRMEPTAAEVVKYMENSYFAVKTVFVNEFRRLCAALEVDWQSVREGWLLDPRIERDHSDAFSGAPGYGGRCLPKDVAAIVAHADSIGAAMPLLKRTQQINADLRAQQ